MYTGKHIILTPFEKEDAVLYRTWVNTPEIMQYLDRISPVTASDHEQWYSSLLNHPAVILFAIRYQQALIGCVWLYDIHYRHRKAEVRILIGPHEAHNKKLGLDTLLTLSDFAFAQLNLHKLYAYVLENNPRALKCFQNAGFREEGRLRAECYQNNHYLDVIRLGRLKIEKAEEPEHLLPSSPCK
jgi:diamine N-acetyltransferase